MKRITFLLYLFSFFFALNAQILDPIKWSFSIDEISESERDLIFRAKIDSGWHLYGTELPEGGPIATEFNFESVKGAKLIGKPKADKTPTFKYDPLFDMELNWFSTDVTFTQKVQLTEKEFSIKGELRFMGCNDENCLPPTPDEFSFKGTGKPLTLAKISNNRNKEQVSESQNTITIEETTNVNKGFSGGIKPLKVSTSENEIDIWKPVIDQLNSINENSIDQESSLLIIFITGFIGGLLALLTPCVWPMIPMTVSFFLKRTKDRNKSIRDALTYGVSIVIIYVALGLIITGVFGASALNSLATNAIFNLLFFGLLVLFAISFLGAFEITLPSSWTTKLDTKADSTTGLLSIFFMAFTLALVSFSCTGPIIGTLLVQAASMGATAGPAIGMFGFALALSIPFSLFAIFPSMLQSIPKSGGWLNSVKVVLGFLELALALKFLSVADLAYGWGILDREVFVALWIIIFILLGIYLLGIIRFSHDSELQYVPVTRLFLALFSLSFAMYMIPGLWGAPLKAISAFAPPLTTQDFNLYTDNVHAEFSDFDLGMEYAQKHKKPVLIDFSGYGCVNCRKMEATVWTDKNVKSIIDNDYVLITLYVDDKTPLEQPLTIEEYGKTRTLKTVGDKWSYLQRHKFGSNSQPFYVIVDEKGTPLAPSYSYNESIENYINFLNTGLENFVKK